MGGNSMARGGQGGGNYGMYGMGGSYTDGNSYNYYDPRYDMPMYSMARGYSRAGSKEETLSELKELMNNATDEATKMALQEAITKMNK